MSINKNDENSKENRLLSNAFKLFTEKGIKDTSIQEIVDNANVAKGTFYLYFKDKYEIRDVLITKKSEKLFSDALASLRKNYISNFSDQIIYVINYVIDELNKNQILLKFISKNLSWGVYNKTLWTIYETNEEKGDTLYSIAKKYNTTVDELKKLNNLTNNTLSIGQTLKVPYFFLDTTTSSSVKPSSEVATISYSPISINFPE